MHSSVQLFIGLLVILLIVVAIVVQVYHNHKTAMYQYELSKCSFIQGIVQYSDHDIAVKVGQLISHDSRFKLVCVTNQGNYDSYPELCIRGRIRTSDGQALAELLADYKTTNVIDKVFHIPEGYETISGIWFIGPYGQWTDSIWLQTQTAPEIFQQRCIEAIVEHQLKSVANTTFDI